MRLCDNSLIVLKMRFQVFSFPRKKVQGFSSDRKILLLLSVLFHLQSRVSVFWNFNFQPRYLFQDISPYLLSKTNWKKSETRFCRRKTAEDNNDKINVSSNKLANFCSSNLVHFFEFSFREMYLSLNCTCPFWERQFISIVKCLTFLCLFITLLKNIH